MSLQIACFVLDCTLAVDSTSGSLRSILIFGGLLRLFQLQRFLPQRCGARLLCAAVRAEDRWIPVELRLRCFVLFFTKFLRLVAQLVPLVALHLRDRRDLVLFVVFDLAYLAELHIRQRVAVSRGVVENLHGIRSLLTFLAMSRRDPRCVTQFARNFGCAVNLVLDPMILQDSQKRCSAFALHLEF